MVRDEVLRARIAAWGLQVLAVSLLGYAVFLAMTPRVDQPSWEFLALLAFAGFCVATPLIAKVSLSKDGGGLDFSSPVDLIDRFEARAQAARTESFEQTRLQISALSLQVQELSDAFHGRPDALLAKTPSGGSSSEPTLRQIREMLGDITDDDDQQKGRFGGDEGNKARRLSARYLPSEFGKDWGTVVLTLSSLDGKPLQGAFAYFFLHETFDPDTYRVKVSPNAKQVSFEIAAEGAFTAGVAAERGATLLEIDLATSANFDAPKAWRER